MKLKHLIKSLDEYNTSCALRDFEVAGISCNSRQTRKNFIFVAIKGAKYDGNKFIREAIDKGAKVIVHSSEFIVDSLGKAKFIRVQDARKALAKLAAEFYGNPSRKIKVVGVTGTNGKTTVTYLIEALLKENAILAAVMGTVNYRFKDRIIPAKNTTPGPIELQSLLSQIHQQGITYTIMEVSSHALSQDRVGQIDFHSAIFTNLTQDHLDYHLTLENYFQAKNKLFRQVNSNSFVILNHDDTYAKRIREQTPAQVITYGIENKSDYSAKEIKPSLSGTEFILVSAKDKIRVRTQLIGRHNVYNILASFAWAAKEGLDLSRLALAIEKFKLVPGRLERIDSECGFTVFVDYAHTADALKNVITSLRQVASKRIILVFGCGGERDKTKRPKMGNLASELSDYCLITNDNPRSEDPQKIIGDILSGIKKDNYCVVPERREAIKKALRIAGSGDIILLAGKGHESYQILKDQRIDFDDRKVVKECLSSENY